LAITNGYCTLADVKAALRITDTVDDVLLENSINAASRMVDQYCNRYFYSGAAGEVRYFQANDAFNCWIDDCQSITELRTAQTNPITYNQIWASTDYQTQPANTFANGGYQPITGLRAIYNYFFPTWQESYLVKVTGTWGWPSVPEPIKFATVIQASRLYKRLESPLGVAGISDIGIMRVGSSVDGDVAQLINPFRLLRTGA
jgi:Phage gp6-like head-tail connector protein